MTTVQRLGDHTTILSGFAFKSEYFNNSEGMPLVRIRDVTRGFSETRYRGDFDARYIIRDGDMLIGMDGEFNIVRWSGGDALLNQRVCRITPSNGAIHAGYLFWFMPNALKLIEAKTPFVTVKHLSVRDIQDIEIPLPPLAEQKRIAGILDKADSIRRRRRSAIDLTTQLADSLFLDLFGDPRTNPKGWQRGHISDLSADVQYGTSKKAGGGRLPILRMNNITPQGTWRLDDLKYIDLDDSEIDKFTVRAGDLLFNRTNSPDLVGKTAVFLEEQPMAYAGYLIRLRPKHFASADYISGFLNSRYGKVVLRGMCKHIIGMANINATELRNIPIALPPLSLQESYQKSMAGIRRLRGHFVRAADTADKLFHSLVQRAFGGEV